MKHPIRHLGILTLTLCAGCASDEPWTFALSRAFYDSAEPSVVSPSCDSGGGDAIGYVVLLALPLALDVVFLPVALPRDLIVMD